MSVIEATTFYYCWWPLTSPNKKQAVEALAARTAKCLGVSLKYGASGDETNGMQMFSSSSAEFEYRAERSDKMISMGVAKSR